MRIEHLHNVACKDTKQGNLTLNSMKLYSKKRKLAKINLRIIVKLINLKVKEVLKETSSMLQQFHVYLELNINISKRISFLNQH